MKALHNNTSLFMVANDKFYRCADPVEEMKWEEITELSALYKAGYIVSLAFAEKGDADKLSVLCSNGKLYYTNFE